jgi:hypothetical protein
MQVDAQAIIDSLTTQVGQMNTELIMQRLVVESLTKELAHYKTASDSQQHPIEGVVQ